MNRRSLGVLLIAIGLVGLVGTASAVVAGAGRTPTHLDAPWAFHGVAGSDACDTPPLPGQTVDVVLADMRGATGAGMMGNGRRMSVTVAPPVVTTGDVSFRVVNAGMMDHELVVLPLPAGGAGTRPIGPDGTVDEAGSLGEVSNPCGEGAGEGLAPGTTGWTTLHLDPGRYELLCNLPGHYAAGMYIELDVR